ncbi:MAG: CotH kinase family protein [Thermoflexales bacterium]|nr:CotH kinase family protein [Thermoflexales bacterium]
MAERRDTRRADGQRRLEAASIFLFCVASSAILVAHAARPGTAPAPGSPSPELTVQASAMPNQGWAPLLVYFSAYGSRSPGSSIVRYEWDLDGNGQLDYDASGQGGYATYLYSKPGDYTITLRVTDAQGRFATGELTISVRHPASSSVDYWSVFDDSRVGRIDIALAQADWDALWADPIAKHQVRAGATVMGERLEDVGFRMRGQFSLRESGAKKPWKIDTDAYVDGQEYKNLRQLMLLNSIGDPSLLQEKLAYEMMAFAGLPASHVAYVELWIDVDDDAAPLGNGVPPLYWGVYAMVERVDNKYLANRFGRDSLGGNLYKASHAQRGPMNLVYYGERIEDYPTQNGQYAYGKMNNEAEADYSDIIALCRVVDGTQYDSEEAFVQALESVLNVDAFLRYMAVVNSLDNWDSYPNTGNNYYLFNNPLSGKFEWIPWDLTWGGNAQAPLLGHAGGELVGRAPLHDNVFKVERYRRRYAAYVDLLLRYWFTPEHVSSLAQQYHRMIAPYVIQSTGDKAFFGPEAMFPYQAFADSWQSLVAFSAERNAYLQSALQQEQIGADVP